MRPPTPTKTSYHITRRQMASQAEDAATQPHAIPAAADKTRNGHTTIVAREGMVGTIMRDGAHEGKFQCHLRHRMKLGRCDAIMKNESRCLLSHIGRQHKVNSAYNRDSAVKAQAALQCPKCTEKFTKKTIYVAHCRRVHGLRNRFQVVHTLVE
ncbi:hypothetical protein BJ170DRAFT_595619 [Xylariales sp. AK1849]|nr:hypothetical protein BJ170DRAFT_595619 [Xylariales sp. AK1849]